MSTVTENFAGEKGLDAARPDPDIVTWDGINDPANPKNWSAKDKWILTLILSIFSLVTLFSPNMTAPALPSVTKDLHITSSPEAALTLSIFMLAYSFGHLIFAPLSELYGRKPVLQVANIWYLVWNCACGFSTTGHQMIAFRFMSGVGASATYGISSGVLGDCWHPKDRGKSLAIYNLIPLLGPGLGPILGGVIAQKTTWRWIFWSTSAFCLALQIVSFMFFRESYAPVILRRKMKKLRKETGNDRLHTEFEGPDQKLLPSLRRSFTRPFIILFTHPIIQISSMLSAYGYGVLYITLTSWSTIWMNRYGLDMSKSGLHYFALTIGEMLGAQIGAHVTDWAWRRLQTRGSRGPEDRLPLIIPGTLIVPTGLLLFGWAAEKKFFWLVVDLGGVLYGIGSMLSGQVVSAYVIDTYGQYSSSALAGSLVLRSLTAFSFPLFAPAMYRALGFGWANTVLALTYLVLAVPISLTLWKFGAKLREGHSIRLEI
ncbi:MAG: hypothetical protein M1820_010485 [Bogoriella megaspora]|nr:MAG: hypothetical protein M1820_010485 [Bogoriella megaspora]